MEGWWELGCGIEGGNADCLGSGRRRRVIPSAKYDPGNKNGHSALSYSPLVHKKNLLATFDAERPPFRKTHL